MSTELIEAFGFLLLGVIGFVCLIVGAYSVWNRLVTRRIKRIPELRVVKDETSRLG